MNNRQVEFVDGGMPLKGIVRETFTSNAELYVLIEYKTSSSQTFSRAIVKKITYVNFIDDIARNLPFRDA